MLEKIFNGAKIREKALDATWLRNEAVSENIANVNTPGYKRKTVAFEQFLTDAVESGKSNIDDITPRVVEDGKSLSYRLDGNNVDIENEMASMAKNIIQYNTLVQNLNGYFRKMKSVINEGRR